VTTLALRGADHGFDRLDHPRRSAVPTSSVTQSPGWSIRRPPCSAIKVSQDEPMTASNVRLVDRLADHCREVRRPWALTTTRAVTREPPGSACSGALSPPGHTDKQKSALALL